VYGAFVVLFAAVLLYELEPALSPILAFIVFVVLLSPYSGTKRHTLAIIAASLVLFVWVMETLGSLLAPFIVAFAIAYILDPVVDRLEGRRIPRAAAIAILALPALGLLAIVIFIAIPALIDQLEAVIASLPTVVDRAAVWLDGLRARFERMGVPVLSRLAVDSIDPERIGAYFQERQEQVLRGGWNAILGVGRGFGTALTILGYLFLTPILIVYLLRDIDNVKARAVALIPEPRRERWLVLLREYDGLLSRFLRGQLLAALIVGVLTWLGLWIAGFPYASLVGAVAGVFNLVPYLGLIVSVIPVLVIAVISGSFLGSLLKAGIVFVIVQLIDSSVTGPRIVGESVGLHPVWVMLALAIGSFFFGFVGLLIAMPAAVLIKLLLRESLARYHDSRVFRGGPEAEEPR
jgi:predicted PurR-regulated permease PerM